MKPKVTKLHVHLTLTLQEAFWMYDHMNVQCEEDDPHRVKFYAIRDQLARALDQAGHPLSTGKR